MTIDIRLVLLFVFGSGCVCGAAALGVVGVRYILKLWQRLCDVNRDWALAYAELQALKNRQVVHLSGRQQILWGLLGSIEKHLLLEYYGGELSRVEGSTSDLSIFPELTPEQLAAIAKFLAKTVKVAAKIAAGGGASLSN